MRYYILFILFFLAGNFLFAQTGIIYKNSDSVFVSSQYAHAAILPAYKLVKTSGILGIGKNGKIATNATAEDQIHQAFENLRHILTSAGSSFADVFEVEVYLTDSSYLQTYRKIRQLYMNNRKDQPVSTLVFVKGLILPDAIIEIKVSALLPGN